MKIMADLYVESIVRRKPVPGGKIFRTAFAVIGIVFVLLGLSWSLVFLIPAVIFGLGYLWAYMNLDVEFEYLYMEDSFDIDKVIANSTRKKAVSIDMNRVIVVAPKGSAVLDRYKQLKTVDYSARDAQDPPYVMVCSVNGTKKNYLLQLDAKMLAALKRRLRGKFEE